MVDESNELSSSLDDKFNDGGRIFVSTTNPDKLDRIKTKFDEILTDSGSYKAVKSTSIDQVPQYLGVGCSVKLHSIGDMTLELETSKYSGIVEILIASNVESAVRQFYNDLQVYFQKSFNEDNIKNSDEPKGLMFENDYGKIFLTNPNRGHIKVIAAGLHANVIPAYMADMADDYEGVLDLTFQ